MIKQLLRFLLFFFLIAGNFSNLFPKSKSENNQFNPGQTYYGRNQYVEYFCGNMPLIISVPHGGKLEPSEIADRSCGETVLDANTQELARTIITTIFSKFGKYPHIIINRLSRKKLDANREQNEATCGDLYSAISFNEYHNFIDSAKAIVVKNYGKGLLIDLHGHGHTIQQLEIGYLLTSSDLAQSDANLNSSYYINKSSIKNLALNSNLSFSNVIRGETSLGAFFEYRNYPSCPGNITPNPGSNSYFNGGYTTQRHGSVNGGTINAVQIECNYSNVRDTENNRIGFASAFADALQYYMDIHLFNKTTIQNKLSFNEVLFDIPLDQSGTEENEGDVNGDGIRSVRGDEFIEIINVGNYIANVGGLQILEKNFKPIFTFPENTMLQSEEYTVVFGGVGANGFGPKFPPDLQKFAAVYNNADSGFYYSSSKTNLLSAGDNIFLFDPKFNIIYDELCWGSSGVKTKTGKKLVAPNTLNNDSISGAIQQSVTKNPDKTGLWVRHLLANNKLYSPGYSTTASCPDNEILIPKYTLAQNFPNPFNPTTTIKFSIPKNEFVKINIFNSIGELILSRINKVITSGEYQLNINMGDYSSGIYYYTIQAGIYFQSKKMILIK